MFLLVDVATVQVAMRQVATRQAAIRQVATYLNTNGYPTSEMMELMGLKKKWVKRQGKDRWRREERGHQCHVAMR